jgi:hypothetical protein
VAKFGRHRSPGRKSGDGFSTAVASVLGVDGKPTGAAFLISETDLLTCAHVVTRALRLPDFLCAAPDTRVKLEFPLANPPAIRYATVVPSAWQPERRDESGDVARLRLVDHAPASAHPLRLVQSDQFFGHKFEAFGFPASTGRTGSWFNGDVRGNVRAGWMELVASERGHPIEEGFSGAPVRDQRTHHVVGMVVAYDQEREGCGYMIPSRLLPAVKRTWLEVLQWVFTAVAAGVGRVLREVRKHWLRALAALVEAVALFAVLTPVVRPAPTCSQPVVVRVAASPDGLGAYQSVASEYEQWVADRHNGCRAVSLYVYPVAPVYDASAVPAGTGPSGLTYTGVNPDVWLSGAAVTLDDIQRFESEAHLAYQQIASTPLVLAVPRRLVNDERDSKDRRGTRLWSELFRRASLSAGEAGGRGLTGAGWSVVRPDPVTSLVGRLATAKFYNLAGDVAQARHDIEQPIEDAQDAGGYPLGDDSALLCRQRTLAGVTGSAAIITTEQAVIRYNLGLPIGGNCTGQSKPDADVRLAAFYPADTPTIDQVVVQLMWPDPMQGSAVRRAASDFRQWITGTEGKTALLSDGDLRPLGYTLDPSDENLLTDNGALPEWPFNHDLSGPVPPSTQHAVLKLYGAAHIPGRVLVALDMSGSMRTAAGDRRRTRFQIALDGVKASLKLMGGDDEFGLGLFSTALPDGVQMAVTLGQRANAQDAAVDNVRAQVVPNGDTPLYRAIDTGIKTVRAPGGSNRPQRRAVVVLTDGQDTASRTLRPDVSGGTRARVFVVAIGEASCGIPALAAVTSDTGGQCFTAEASTVDQTLNALFETLWDKGDA